MTLKQLLSMNHTDRAVAWNALNDQQKLEIHTEWRAINRKLNSLWNFQISPWAFNRKPIQLEEKI